jgi:hypothetical protein
MPKPARPAEKKLVIILENAPGSVLDRVEVPTPARHKDPDGAANDAIHKVIDEWTLSPGDVIRIIDGDDPAASADA